MNNEEDDEFLADNFATLLLPDFADRPLQLLQLCSGGINMPLSSNPT
jgi:hypothetical protein